MTGRFVSITQTLGTLEDMTPPISDRTSWRPARTNRRYVSRVGDMNPSIPNPEYAINGDGTRVVFSTRTSPLNANPESGSR